MKGSIIWDLIIKRNPIAAPFRVLFVSQKIFNRNLPCVSLNL